MMKMLPAIIGLLFPLTLLAQEHEFEYRKRQNVVYLEGDETNYAFLGQEANSAGSQFTEVQCPDGTFRVLAKTDKYGVVKKVLNSKDSLLATFIDGKNSKTILLPDGRTLEQKKVNNIKWTYLENGKEVITYRATQKDNRRRVMIEYHDATFELEAIQILCLDHGRTKLKANPVVGAFIAGAVVTSIMAIVSSQNDKTTYP